MVIIVMDTLDSTHFLNAIQNNPEFSDSFDDFTYYSDAMAAYPFTMHSLPMILTGQWHENAEPFNEYAENAYKNSPLLQKLETLDYKMGIYANVTNMFTVRSFKDRFENHLVYEPRFTNLTDACKQVVKMAGIKYAPWILKGYCYDLLDSLTGVCIVPGSEYNGYNWYMPNWYHAMANPSVLEVVDERCFRFIHVCGAHTPFHYNKTMTYVEPDVAVYQDPVDACVTFADRYIKLLKENGVYDNTIIIFMGDHGFDPEVTSLLNRFHTALMIKGLNETGDEMTINNTPVSYEYVMQAFMKLLDQVPSGEIFDEYVSDTRRLIWYQHAKEHLMKEYVSDGHASDFDSKKFTGVEFTRDPY